MPEIKHTFSKGRMNKDLDERLVPNGEYRDALNVEVSTSEGSNVGAVQTLKGSTALTSGKVQGGVDAGSTTVGSIVDEKTDKIYWLVAGPKNGITSDSGTGSETHTIHRDVVLEYDSVVGAAKYVFVDIWRVKIDAVATAVSGSANITLGKTTGIRRDMILTGGTNYAGTSVKPKVSSVNHSTGVVTIDGTINVASAATLIFHEPPINPSDLTYPPGRALDFSHTRLITGINILDDFLMWTDNHSEPKKINITRSIQGTGGDDTTLGTGSGMIYQTRVVIRRSGGTYYIPADTGTTPFYAEQRHITVIKKPPLVPPKLIMSKNMSGRGNIESFDTDTNFSDGSGNILNPGDTKTLILNASPAPLDIREGDILVGNVDAALAWNFVDYLVRCEITSITQGASTFTVEVSILSADPDIALTDEYWYFKLEQSKPLFEFKFPRFSYRYKYEDGEYSAFAPWSEIAFLPEEYDYLPKKGYNLGMTNNLRSLKIRDFVAEKSIRPEDVIEIDILYKEDGSPNVYTVKTVKKDSDEWDAPGSTGIVKGEIEIESELIHATLPSNQLIRPWDNVPRVAKAQDITKNRLVYGNYLQNYDLKWQETSQTTIEPQINTSLVTNQVATLLHPEKSIKTLRTYQIGVVYRDIYGRETPVLTNSRITAQGSVNSADIKVEKKEATLSTQIQVDLVNTPPYWSDSFKFFIKETSNEYYNLSMDRWYNAQDGNVWLVFNSADRNKVDENTYLIMKKQHDSDGHVDAEARYKILAIENEAPDFIKINREVLGVITNTTVSGVTNGVFGDTAGTSGFPLEDRNEIHIDGETWLESTLTEAQAKNCKLRFTLSDGQASLWYKTAAIKHPESSSDLCKIKLDGALGTDVSFTSTAGTYATRVNGIMMEIRSETSENRPEFDGKFFVKILGDQVFKENANVQAGVSINTAKVVESQMSIRWIDTGLLDGTTDEEDPDGNAVASKNMNVYPNAAGSINNPVATDPTRPQITQPDKALTYNTTVDATNYSGWMTPTNWNVHLGSGYSLNSAGNFDGGDMNSSAPQEYGGFGHYKHDILSNTNILSNDTGNEGAEFWRDFALAGTGGTNDSDDDNHLFIDMAYFRQQRKNNGDKISSTEDMSGLGIRDNYGFPTQIVAGVQTVIPGDYQGSIAPNPNNEDLIDISFANIHPDATNSQMNPFSSATYSITGDFIDKLTSPGTEFRFTEDPDQVEYTVTGMVRMDGIQNYHVFDNSSYKEPENKRTKWTLAVSPKFGQGPSGYHPTKPRTHAEVDTAAGGCNNDGYGYPSDYDWTNRY